MSLTKVVWYGQKAKAAEQAGAREGLYRWAEHVLEQSTRLVPHQEGTLQDSGTAHEPGTSGLDASTAAVSYDTPYAVVQHEAMEFSHPNGRQAKYLETPLNASKVVGERLLAESIKAKLGD